MADTDYDVLVIGAGPGGYVCAIRAAQLGLKVGCIDKRGSAGGTCLNVGCIPSKALLQSSHHYHLAQVEFAAHGIALQGVSLDLATMMARKNKVVKDLTSGISGLFRKNKVDELIGHGRIDGPGRVTLTAPDGAERALACRHIVIATGSEPTSLPGLEIDERRVVSSTGALELSQVPEHMVLIGGGVIGLEMGSVWSRLGAKVTVVEYLDKILAPFDDEVARQMQQILGRQGMTFMLGHKVTDVAGADGDGPLQVSVMPRDGAETQILEADTVLVAIGRRPNTDALGLQDAGVAMDDRGFVQVNGDFQTNVPGIFAIGDVIGGQMLAHKAEDEGVACAEILAGQTGHVNYAVIPSVVYTWPEVGAVGRTEQELKAAGIAYRVGKFPFKANSRARANDDTDGFVKILADAQTDRILGAHVIGPAGGDVLAELAVAMEFGAAAEDIARSCHHHPSLSEAVKEAALAVDGRPIHI